MCRTTSRCTGKEGGLISFNIEVKEVDGDLGVLFKVTGNFVKVGDFRKDMTLEKM